MRCRLTTHRVAKSSARPLTKQRLPAGTESSFAAWLSIRIAKRSRLYCQCKGPPAGHQAFPHQHASSPMPVQAPGQKAPGPDQFARNLRLRQVVNRTKAEIARAGANDDARAAGRRRPCVGRESLLGDSCRSAVCRNYRQSQGRRRAQEFAKEPRQNRNDLIPRACADGAV